MMGDRKASMAGVDKFTASQEVVAHRRREMEFSCSKRALEQLNAQFEMAEFSESNVSTLGTGSELRVRR